MGENLSLLGFGLGFFMERVHKNELGFIEKFLL